MASKKSKIDKNSLLDLLDIDSTSDSPPTVENHKTNEDANNQLIGDEDPQSKKKKYIDYKDYCKYCGAIVFRINRHYRWCNGVTIRCRCRERFQTIELYNSHIIDCSLNDTIGSVGCNQCDRAFTGPEALGAHCKLVHGSNYSVQSILLRSIQAYRKWRERLEYEHDIRFRHYGSTKMKKEGGIKMRCHEMFPMKKRGKYSQLSMQFDEAIEKFQAVKGCSAFISYIELENGRVRVIYSLDHSHPVSYRLQNLSPITLRKIYRLYRDGHDLGEVWDELQEMVINNPVPIREKMLTFTHLKVIYNNFKAMEIEEPERADNLLLSDCEVEDDENFQLVSYDDRPDEVPVEIRSIVSDCVESIRSTEKTSNANSTKSPSKTKKTRRSIVSDKDDNDDDREDNNELSLISPPQLVRVTRHGRQSKVPTKFIDSPDVKRTMRSRKQKLTDVKERIRELKDSDGLSKDDLAKIELARKLIDEVDHNLSNDN